LKFEEPERHYKKFDFFYKRTCFRLMAEYYRIKYQEFLDTRNLQAKKQNTARCVELFLVENFSGLMETLPEEQVGSFKAYASVILHSHRHNKNNGFMQGGEAQLLDFETVRDTMYKYSKKSQKKFFAVPQLSFFFAHFAKQA